MKIDMEIDSKNIGIISIVPKAINENIRDFSIQNPQVLSDIDGVSKELMPYFKHKLQRPNARISRHFQELKKYYLHDNKKKTPKF